MVGLGRVTGAIFAFIGIAILIVVALWLGTSMSEGGLRSSGAVLGIALVFIFVCLPLLGVGGYLLIRGQGEVKQYGEVEKEKKILNVVETAGQARISDLALETNLSRDQIKNYVYDLVGKGLFTGYIDWKSGVLYAKEASQLQTGKCPSCGGELELAGKGVIKCPYCGAETFL
jgi:hypothetical protein